MKVKSLKLGILLIFAHLSEAGFRVSLFDDEVESIRKFDIEDQNQKEEIRKFSINPAF